MNEEMVAKDIMCEDVVRLSSTTTLPQARNIFLQHAISGAPVVSEHNDLLGVVSQTDLIRAMTGNDIDDIPEDVFFVGLNYWGGDGGLENVWGEMKNKTVVDIMSVNVFTASPGDSISLLARNMRVHNIHRLVITEKGKVVGLVSSMDMLSVVEGAVYTKRA